MRIHKKVKLTSENWLNLYRAEYSHNSFKGEWIYASRNDAKKKNGRRVEAVIIVPVLKERGKENRLVVVKEFRVPIGGYTYGFPAGLMDAGESVERAVQREMAEETGLKVTRIRKVTAPLYSSLGLTDESVVMVYADVGRGQGTQSAPEASEEIEVLFLDYQGVCALCDKPDLPIDAKLWATLYMFQKQGKIN